MRLHDRRIPQRRLSEERQHGVAIARGFGFDRPPEEQRQARVGGVCIVPQHGADNREILLRGQTFRGAGELHADLHILLALGPARRGGDEFRG